MPKPIHIAISNYSRQSAPTALSGPASTRVGTATGTKGLVDSERR